MSWLKEVFDFSNENRDPYIKLLIRLTFLVVFIVLVFYAYNIVTGNSVVIAGFKFAVNNKDSTKKIVNEPVKNADSILKKQIVKTVDSTTVKLSPKHNAALHIHTEKNKISIQKDSLGANATSEKNNLIKTTPSSENRIIPLTRNINSDFTDDDVKNLKRVMDSFAKNELKDKAIEIICNPYDANSVRCRGQADDYFTKNGYQMIEYDETKDEALGNGFRIWYKSTPGDSTVGTFYIYIGSLEGERVYKTFNRFHS